MIKSIGCAAVLLAALCVPGRAQETKQAGLPAIVQKYAATVKSTPALLVIASQEGADDSARIEIAAPNKITIATLQKGKRTETVVCDGVQVREWNAVNAATGPAPATLDKLDPQLPMGAAASIASSLLTDSSNITDYAHLRDTGVVNLHGQATHKVISIEDGDTATFWLASDTGLPLKASFTGGRHDRILTLVYYPVGVSQNILDRADGNLWASFQEQPPAGLKAFVPAPTPVLLPVGTDAPNFALPNASALRVSRRTTSLSGLKGQVVLLDFWASWCRPCKKTMPHIQSLRQTLGPKGLTVLSINTWDSEPKMQAFLKAHPQYTTTFLYDASPAEQSVAVAKYHVYGIPTVYVIGKDGKVAGAFIGDDPQAAAQIEQALARLGID